MSKSIKLKNETYIDSSSISHNKKLLNNILNGNHWVGDINNVYETGVYRIDGNSCQNIPPNAVAKWGVLLVFRSIFNKSNYISQIFIGNYGNSVGRISIRNAVTEDGNLQNLTWGEWYYL